MIGIFGPYAATFKEEMSFLECLFHDKGQKHRANAVARSALLTIFPNKHGKTFGKDPDVSIFIKEMFNLRAPLPEYIANLWNWAYFELY